MKCNDRVGERKEKRSDIWASVRIYSTLPNRMQVDIFILIAIGSHWRMLRREVCHEIYAIHSYKQQTIRNPMRAQLIEVPSVKL